MRLAVTDRALAMLTWQTVRRGALVWAAIFAVLIVSSIVAYGSSFATAAERMRLAASTSANGGLQALFGQARALDTVQGFTAWRCGGLIPPIGAILGLTAATRMLRGQEEDGRWELLTAASITRARASAIVLGVVGAAGLVAYITCAAATAVAGSAHGFGLGSSLLFAVSMLAPGAVFAAVGAVASQLFSVRRRATAVGVGVFALAFLLRVVADGSNGAHWVRWLTPLGWAEELHPLTGAQPLALLPLVITSAALTALALRLASRRDLGSGVLGRSEPVRSDLRLLGSPASLAIRNGAGSVAGWSAGVAASALLFGLIARGVVEAAKGALERAASTLGGTVSPAGYIGFGFVFVVLGVSIYAAMLVGAIRDDEASGRVDNMLVAPLTRTRWLLGRLGVAIVSLVVVALVAGLAGWLGATIGGAGVSLGSMLDAGVNVLPPAVLFLGLVTLIFGLSPRSVGSLGTGIVVASFLLAIVGESLSAPSVMLDLSVFHHVAVVPGGKINAVASALMLAIGTAAAVGGVLAFGRRDLAAA